MNNKMASDALYEIANALYKLAESLEEQPAARAGEAVTGRVLSPGPVTDDEDFLEEAEDDGMLGTLPPRPQETAAPVGFASQCPKHRKPYKQGRYGLFCTEVSDDPAWRNDKGFCRITPKNAAIWLRQQAQVAT